MKTLDVSSAEFCDLAESPTYNRLSFGGASVSFRVPVSRFSSCPFDEGEIVKVVWQGKTLLIGPVINPEHSLDGESESWDIKIFDYWWNLSNIQYFSSGRSRGIFASYRYGGDASEAKKQATAKMEEALKGILDHAIRTALIPIKYDLRIDKAAELIPFAYSSETYASLLIQIQKWRPNMAAWFEYGADDSVTLVIADHASLPDVVLDLSAVDVSTLSIKARPDLVPPAVGLTCNAAIGSNVQRAVTVYPEGASLSQPYVVTAEVDVPDKIFLQDSSGEHEPVETGSLGYDAPRMTVRGGKFPTTKAQWIAVFKRWFPALADCSNLEVTNLPVVSPLTPANIEHGGYSRDAISHELTDGQINGKSGKIKWGKAKVEARLRATNPPDTAKQYFPEHAGKAGDQDRWIGLLTVEVTTTNVAHARYLMDDRGTVEYLDEGAGSIDPGNPGDAGEYDCAGLYKGLVRSIYESTRVMPYDGSITVHDDFDHVCGGRLSITGGVKAWEAMRTVIQEVSLDLKTGVSDVTVGAQEQLSLQDSIDKSRQLAEAMKDTASASTRTNSGDGTAGGTAPDVGGNTGPVSDRSKPELPSVGPSVKLLQGQEPPAWGTSSVEVGYQCRLSFGDSGQVEKAYIRQGRAMYAGNYIGGMLPEGSASGGWVESPTTAGEVWLKITLDKDAKYIGSYLTAVGGVSDPVQLGEEDRQTPYEYFFHLATIDGNKVVQHQAGTVYLQYDPGTFGPSGKS